MCNSSSDLSLSSNPDASITRQQLATMCRKLYAASLNIDYYPTNFVVEEGLLFYIDYECNPYSDRWNFENWGSKYWEKTPEFIAAFGE